MAMAARIGMVKAFIGAWQRCVGVLVLTKYMVFEELFPLHSLLDFNFVCWVKF